MAVRKTREMSPFSLRFEKMLCQSEDWETLQRLRRGTIRPLKSNHRSQFDRSETLRSQVIGRLGDPAI